MPLYSSRCALLWLVGEPIWTLPLFIVIITGLITKNEGYIPKLQAVGKPWLSKLSLWKKQDIFSSLGWHSPSMLFSKKILPEPKPWGNSPIAVISIDTKV